MAELGSGNGTSYPAALDVDNSVEADSSTTARADVPNDLAAAVIAVQTELGTDPAGTQTNVKTFLQTEHATNGTHSNITANNLTLAKTLIQKGSSEIRKFKKDGDNKYRSINTYKPTGAYNNSTMMNFSDKFK